MNDLYIGFGAGLLTGIFRKQIWIAIKKGIKNYQENQKKKNQEAKQNYQKYKKEAQVIHKYSKEQKDSIDAKHNVIEDEYFD